MEASTPIEPVPAPETIRAEARLVVAQHNALIALAAEIDYADTDRLAQLWDDYNNPKVP